MACMHDCVCASLRGAGAVAAVTSDTDAAGASDGWRSLCGFVFSRPADVPVVLVLLMVLPGSDLCLKM
jgi:hypothetical protein